MKKMMIRSEKGFTLIELLVVIAIIAILSTIVLASLGSARGRSRDTRAQSEMSNMRAQAELYYTANGDYGASTNDCGQGIFSDTTSDSLAKLVTSVSDIVTNTKISCSSTGQAWAVAAILPTSKQGFCVDSQGTSKVTEEQPATAGELITSAACE